MAPNMAISTAPMHTRTVPPNDQRVKGSPRMSEAHIELKARPAWYGFSDNIFEHSVGVTYRLESGEDRKGQSSKLNGAADKIADKEHKHAQL